ncbi:MAG: hypothetical protein EOP47_14020 [Sphingobacteriaceae bacterium]|nr:MAG: hypothetical protein EOP47_14020 [Sphingobacteriaceae bacterium]
MVTPLETPDKLNHTSILHFPKSSWYFAAAVLRLFGTVEMGKAYNIIALFAAFGIVYTLFRDLTQSAVRSLVLTVLVLLNPVIWSEITTYLNDGDLYLFLVTYLAAIILWLRDPKPAYVLIGSMAVICLVNIKFTGLVFFLGSSFFAFIYILIKKSHFTKKFLLSHLIAGIIAVGIFGFNPYVTNMLKRGHPLYPVMGSKEFPGVFDKGADDNEAYETPQNMKGKSFPVRLLYANFGRPGNAPYNDETEAILSNPFTSDLSSWTAYHFHETRVSGFGPYFGVALVLLIIALPILLIRGRDLLIPVLVFFAGLICCMALSKHFWWPRFFPMLWLAPIIPLILLWTGHTLADHRNKAGTIYGWLLALLIGVNGLIVAVTHMRWETTSSANLRSELQHIQETKQPIQIDYGWFNRSMEEKLKHWDIKYTTGPLSLADTAVHKLTSVVKGYPNQVLYRVK